MLDGMSDVNGYGAAGLRAADPSRAFQKTLKSPIHCSGVGLHSGERIAMSLHPAAPDTGIVFRRTDGRFAGATVPARYDMVRDTRLCTALVGEGGAQIGTVEHLMAAFAGCEIDNAVVELSGPEVPIMDGSSEPFVFLIECAGIEVQDILRRAIRVKREITVEEGSGVVSLSPSEGFSIGLSIEFASKAIGRQELFVSVDEDTFRSHIAKARTFGFLHEVEALRQAGLARGGSLDNAVVVSGDRILNEGGLRYEDEFVRHKVLDCIGDLYLAGAPIIGHYKGRRPGHALHNALLRALFADSANYEIVPFVDAVDGLPSLARYGMAV
jgi:UDP-3-O-[3-hydroxymyristoyl] N-acetylglucosamine deacetylase